jgi:hypothetical protein
VTQAPPPAGAGLRARIPPGERIVAEAGGTPGEPAAMLARGAAGETVLYSARAAIVDVAEGAAGAPLGWTVFSVMFGASSPGRRSGADEPPRGLREWLAADPARGARVYRTGGGFRYLLTAAPLDPASAEADRTLRRLGAEPRERRRCRERHAYRAVLEPDCRFVAALGAPGIHPEVAPVVELHDTRAAAISAAR